MQWLCMYREALNTEALDFYGQRKLTKPINKFSQFHHQNMFFLFLFNFKLGLKPWRFSTRASEMRKFTQNPKRKTK